MAKTKEKKMNNVVFNRDYLSKIFNSLGRDDAAWALQALSDRLSVLSKATSKEDEYKIDAVWNKPLPKAVLNMTMHHRKAVSYNTDKEYKADLAQILEEKIS